LASTDIQALLADLGTDITAIGEATRANLSTVSQGRQTIATVTGQADTVAERIQASSDAITALAAMIRDQRAATDEIAQNSGHIAQKAVKTGEEVRALTGALSLDEAKAHAALDRTAGTLPERAARLRLEANLAAWNRRIAAVLLGATPEVALADEPRRWADGSDADEDRRLTMLVDDARALIAAVGRADYAAATASYVAIQDRIATFADPTESAHALAA
jgi:hypothetical protein